MPNLIFYAPPSLHGPPSTIALLSRIGGEFMRLPRLAALVVALTMQRRSARARATAPVDQRQQGRARQRGRNGREEPAAEHMNGSNKPKDSPFYSDAGKLVLLRVSGTDLARVGEAAIGHWSQGAAFSPDGKHVFVGNMVEKDIQVLSLDGATLKDTGGRIAVKGGPAAIRIADK